VESRRAPSRAPARAALALLLAAGAAARLHGLGRSLWLDEAWVANSVLAPDLAGMLRYEAWLQTTPPLLLVLVRTAVRLWGESNAVLRAVPAAFALAGLALFAWLAWRWLRPPAALAALACFALSPELVAQGAALKQYGSDAFAALVLLAAGAAYLERPGTGRLAAALGAAALLSLLCVQAPLFLLALPLAALPRPGVASRAPASHALAAAGTALAASVAVAALFIAPNREPSLLEYFRSGFYPGGGVAELAAWLGGRLRLLAAAIPGAGAHAPWDLLALALAALGVADLARRGLAGEPRAGAHAALLAAPVAGALAANLAGILPMTRGTPRVLLFLYPGTALALGAGIEALARGVGSALGSRDSARGARAAAAAGWTALAAVCLGLAAAAAHGDLAALSSRPPAEDAQGAVAFLARETAREDVLYVHSAMRESYRLYARRTPLAAARVVLGVVDAPCCPRGLAFVRDENPARVVPAELARIAHAGAAGRRLWVLATAREGHFRQRGHRFPELLARGLAAQGCTREATGRFRNVRVERYRCAPPRGV